MAFIQCRTIDWSWRLAWVLAWSLAPAWVHAEVDEDVPRGRPPAQATRLASPAPQPQSAEQPPSEQPPSEQPPSERIDFENAATGCAAVPFRERFAEALDEGDTSRVAALRIELRPSGGQLLGTLRLEEIEPPFERTVEGEQCGEVLNALLFALQVYFDDLRDPPPERCAEQPAPPAAFGSEDSVGLQWPSDAPLPVPGRSGIPRLHLDRASLAFGGRTSTGELPDVGFGPALRGWWPVAPRVSIFGEVSHSLPRDLLRSQSSPSLAQTTVNVGFALPLLRSTQTALLFGTSPFFGVQHFRQGPDLPNTANTTFGWSTEVTALAAASDVFRVEARVEGRLAWLRSRYISPQLGELWHQPLGSLGASILLGWSGAHFP